MSKLMMLLLGSGFSLIVLINIFRSYFTKVFRFISGGLVIAMVISLFCGFFHFISYHEMINALIALGLPHKFINRL